MQIKTKTFKISLIIAILGITLTCCSIYFKTSFVASAVGYICEPIQNMLNSRLISNNQESNDLQQDETNKLRNEIADYYEIKKENESLKKILKLKDDHEDFKLLQADVIGRDPAELFYGITLNQGKNSSVALYNPVITDKGLVGYVSAVYDTYCKINTVLSPSTNISAIDCESSDTGVISADNSLTSNENITFKYINKQNTIKPGDIVTTSGVGGIYPKNLLVGEILLIEQNTNNYDVTAQIKPFEDIKNISEVYIITDFNGMKAKTAKE